MTTVKQSELSIDAPFEERAEALLSSVFGGMHHVHGLKKEHRTWTCLHSGGASTFDLSILTRLVFAAHEYCIRVEVNNGGPGQIKIYLSERTGRDGDAYSRHPDIDEALGNWRSRK